MIPRDFHFSAFENVWNLLWLVPIAALVLYSIFWKRQKIGQLIEENLQSRVIIPRDSIFTAFKFFCFALGWFFAVIALMNPLGNEYYQGSATETVERPPSLDLIFLMDVSSSMAVPDMRNQMTRLYAAEEIADRLVAKLKNDSVALFAFSSQLVPLVPMTWDRTFFRLMLREIEFNEDNHFGTNYATVFGQLKTHIEENYPKSAKAIILFSDGGDTNLESLSGANKSSATDAVLQAAANLNVPIFTVGMGSEAGGAVPDVMQNGKKVISKLDDSLLLAISKRTGGQYFLAKDQSAIDLASRINQSLERPRNTMKVDATSETSGSFHYYFQIPLALSLFFFALYYLFPSVRTVLFLFPLLLNAEDVGKTLYDSGKFAESSEWYAGELKHLPPEWLRNKLLYNLGTSLMAEKKWDEASRAFFAVSKEAYTYPLFRLRLLYNQLLILWYESEKDPEKLREALAILDMVKCGKDCPEHVLEEFREKLTKQLPKEESTPDISSKIRLNRLAYLLQKDDTAKIAFDLNREKQKSATTPTILLESLLDEIPLASALKGQEPEVLKDGRQFYPFVLEWQKKQFSKGLCQCAPWGEALPVFTEGLRALELEPYEAQLFYTYEKWLEALKLLNSKSESSSQSQQQDEEQRELQEMQALDKQKNKAKMQPIGEGMPW